MTPHMLPGVLLVLLCWRACDCQGDFFVSPEDVTVAGWASQSKAELCSGGFQGQVKGDRGFLRDVVGGDNFLVNLIEDGITDPSKDMNQKRAIAREDIAAPFVAKCLGPFVVALVVLLLWILGFCWTACPCCKSCRACAGEHEYGILTKVGVALGVGAVLAGLVAMAVVLSLAQKHIMDGVSNTGCTGASLVNTILNGDITDGEVFIGINPLMTKFQDIDAELNEGSDLLTELDAIIGKTAPIESALVLLTDTLKLLGNVLQLEDNLKPRQYNAGTAVFDPLYHDCVFCAALGPIVNATAVEVDESGSAELYRAREQIRGQLTASRRADLQMNLRNASKPMLDFKEQVRVALEPLVKPGNFKVLKDLAKQFVVLPIIIVLVLALLLLCCGCCSCGVFVARPKSNQGGWSKIPHRTACCSWCCSTPFIVLVMILGGILGVVCVPLASGCDIVDRIDSTLVGRILDATNTTMDGDSRKIFDDMIDRCVVGASSGNTNLLDIVFVRQEDGTNQTLRSRFVTQFLDPITDALDRIRNASGIVLGIASNPYLLHMRALLRDNRIEAMILANQTELSASPVYSPMSQAPALTVGFFNSLKCNNFTVVGNLSSFTGQSIPGILPFVAGLRSLSTSTANTYDECIEWVVCDASKTVPEQSACTAGNFYMDLKRKLLANYSEIYRCDTFSYPDDSTDCDPANMVRTATGWSGDCLRWNSTDNYSYTRTRQKYCNLHQFGDYLQTFDALIDIAARRLDDDTNSTMDAIIANLTSIVRRYVVNELEEVVGGLTCGFLPAYRKSFVNGLCFQSLYGLKMSANAYVIVAAFVILLAAVMYLVWRIAVDNVNLQDAPGKAPPYETRE